MNPHVFIAMPFGIKPGADGEPIDFNRIYETLLRPALEDAGCEVFRADEEQRAGDIRTDMFQELVVADLVVADLTLDNPNVWYELGVRHALRARGVILVQGPRSAQPFDIYADRKLVYRLLGAGPDPATLAEDRGRIAAMARATLAASSKRKLSPVYQLLPHLREPDWHTLLLEGDNEFRSVYETWCGRLEVAALKNRPGDILVLADETPTQPLRRHAKRTAAAALMRLQQFGYAMEQLDAALMLDPDDRACQLQRVVCLGRDGRPEEAADMARQLTQAHPAEPDVWAAAGRVEKDRWIGRWRPPAGASPDTPEQMLASARLERASLAQAIAPYRQAFAAAPSHHHAGINALTLTVLMQHLGGSVDADDLACLAGGVRWAATAARQRGPRDYWAHASWAESCLLLGDGDGAVEAMRAAVPLAERNWFAIDSTHQGVTLLRDLMFRPSETAAVLAVLEREIARLAPPLQPRQVLLFSGHMIDAPGRPVPRFPPSLVPAVAARIAAELEAFDAGPGDLALTQGAAGGDLLFAEACQRRGVDVQLMLPLAEPEFVQRSIMRSADANAWRDRFYRLLASNRLKPRVMPTEIGPPPPGRPDPFERCNLWLLHTALAYGQERLRFMCLWDGGGSDGPGGTRHSLEEAQRRTGRAVWIDIRELLA